MRGDTDHVVPLGINEVSRIHFRGGSHLGISRANPTTNKELLENVVQSLLRLNVSMLITIGGDDTAFSAMKVEEQSNGRIRVVHVPKTIDNDLDLPPHVDTFGFQTARHIGVEIMKNLMVDAKTTSRWYFVVAMGRKAGHLALGIGKAAGATLTLIPEEFSGQKRPREDHRRHAGRRDHQATELRAARRRGGDRGRARPRHRPGRSRAARRGRARRARSPADRRGEHRRDPQSRGPEAARDARAEDDHLRQEHRLRAALRGPDSVRHGVHARSRLLRGEVSAVGRQCRHDLAPGRPLRPGPLLEDDRRRAPAAPRCVW